MVLLMSKRTPVYGVGINDSDYATQSVVDGVKVICPAYSAWKSMLYRVYSKASLDRNPCYKGVVVCDEWLRFMSFRKWWIEHHVGGWCLDKDIIGCGHTYSPSDCIYIPNWINTITSDVASSRGDLMIGVSLSGKKFRANCRHPFGDIPRHIGYFDNEIDAHLAWRRRKTEVINSLKSKMDEIDIRIHGRLIEIIGESK